MCNQPMFKMCEDCGAFFDEPEYIVYDLYNYNAKPQRSYRREDHFKEVLAQFQGCEGKPLPKTVLEQIKGEIKDLETCDVQEIRNILRNLKMTSYVENVYSITFALTGKQPPYIKREFQDKMIKMFRQIIKAYETICREKHRSFMSYYFIIYKLLELMGQSELLPSIPLLRTQLRLRQHDNLWKQICSELDWTYKPTASPSRKREQTL